MADKARSTYLVDGSVQKSCRPCENPTKFCDRARRAKFLAIFSILKGLRARKSEQTDRVKTLASFRTVCLISAPLETRARAAFGGSVCRELHWVGPSASGVFFFAARGAWLSVALRIASTSAMSCGLPAASFAATRSSAEMKFAFNPLVGSITVSTRLSHAESKSTPGISGRISNPRGLRPKRKKPVRSAKSSGRMPCSAAPNLASAAYVALALAGSAFMKRSKSLVEWAVHAR
jgi:hypothetical protein